MMKFSKTMAILTAGLVLAAGCAENSGSHELSLLYPVNGILAVYADHALDSVSYFTQDNWRINVEERWVTPVGPTSGEIPNNANFRYIVTNKLEMEPNTTGHFRKCYVKIQSYEYELYARIFQMGYLNVMHPALKVESYALESQLPDVVSFCLSDSADVTADSLVFHTQKKWTLTPAEDGLPEWITLQNTEGQGGRNTVHFTMQRNNGEQERRTTLQLSSSQVTTPIEIVQLGTKQLEK